jgi:predicted PurR-regulated permease PerM
MNKTGLVPGTLMVLVFIAAAAVLKLTESVVLPLVIALLLSFMLSPLVELLVRRKIPRTFAIVLVILALLGLGFLAGLVLYSSITSLVRSWSAYQSRLVNLFQLVTSRLGLPSNLLNQPQVTQSIGSYALGFFGNFIKFLSSLILVLIFLLFMLLEKRFFRRKMFRAIQGRRTDMVLRVLKHINKQVSRYLTIKILVSLGIGGTIWFFFRVIGVDFAFVWGVLSFLFNFVPAVGSLAVGVVGVLFAIVQFYPGWNPVIAAASVVILAQITFGSIMEPKLQGDNLNLSPVVVLFSLLIWGWLWGLMGMLLSVPLTVAMKITFENIPGLEFIGVLMGTGSIRKSQQDT